MSQSSYSTSLGNELQPLAASRRYVSQCEWQCFHYISFAGRRKQILHLTELHAKQTKHTEETMNTYFMLNFSFFLLQNKNNLTYYSFHNDYDNDIKMSLHLSHGQKLPLGGGIEPDPLFLNLTESFTTFSISHISLGSEWSITTQMTLNTEEWLREGYWRIYSEGYIDWFRYLLFRHLYG